MRKEGGVDLDRCGKKVLGIRFALGIEKQGKSAPSSEAFVEEEIKGEQVGDFESLEGFPRCLPQEPGRLGIC